MEKGEIRFNNIDIKELDTDDLRKHIAVVTQDAVMFNDSIKNNISLDRNYSGTEVLDMCEIVQLSDVISILLNLISPFSTFHKPYNNFVIVDLPQPLSPIMAVTFWGSNFMHKSFNNTSFSRYPKSICFISMKISPLLSLRLPVSGIEISNISYIF